MIIAITGTNGAGKGAVVDYLVRKHGFFHVSAREFLLKELNRRGLQFDRPTMTAVADDLRKNREPKYGSIMLELLKEAEASGKDAIIESVRAILEIEYLRKARPDIKIWAVDADPKIRYDRVVHRKSPTDKVTYEEFIRQENLECENAEPWRGNLPACIKMADEEFINEGSREELEKKIEAALAE